MNFLRHPDVSIFLDKVFSFWRNNVLKLIAWAPQTENLQSKHANSVIAVFPGSEKHWDTACCVIKYIHCDLQGLIKPMTFFHAIRWSHKAISIYFLSRRINLKRETPILKDIFALMWIILRQISIVLCALLQTKRSQSNHVISLLS